LIAGSGGSRQGNHHYQTLPTRARQPNHFCRFNPALITPAFALSAGMCAFAAPTGVGRTSVEYVSKQIRVDGFSGHSEG